MKKFNEEEFEEVGQNEPKPNADGVREFNIDALTFLAKKENPELSLKEAEIKARQEVRENEKDLDENKLERQFNANLLTNYEMTMAFMKGIEGPGWLEDQPQNKDLRGCLEYVMNWLKTAGKDEYSTMLYGWGGGDRYSVRRDGSVKFIASYSIAKTLKRAKNCNFPIDK